jgi:hypothetical protein
MTKELETQTRLEPLVLFFFLSFTLLPFILHSDDKSS